jgi:flagellar basal-body rod protein FlgF
MVKRMEATRLVALSRQLMVKDQMSVTANNIANMSTNGYKGEQLMFREYMAPTGGGGRVTFPQQAGLFRNSVSGTLTRTSNPLDIALKGDGFLAVKAPLGEFYTRNGHLTLDAKGQIMTSEGHLVLNTNGQPMTIDANAKEITIAKDGTISADGQNVGSFKLVKFDSTQQLERVGGTLFRTSAPPQKAEDVEINQGHLEGSNIQPVLEMTKFMSAVGNYQMAKDIVDREDERVRRAVERLGSAPE